MATNKQALHSPSACTLKTTFLLPLLSALTLTKVNCTVTGVESVELVDVGVNRMWDSSEAGRVT